MSWRKHATTAALVVAAASVTGYLVFVEGRGPSQTELEARRGKLLPSFDRSKLMAVRCDGEGGSFVLSRTADGAFRLEAPEEQAADPAAVDRLLATFENATVLRRTEAATARGLGAPRRRCSLAFEKGADLAVSLGDDAASPPGAAYVQVAGEAPAVVSSVVAQELAKPAAAYRDRLLVPFPAGEIARVSLRSEQGAKVELTRLDGVTFRFASGERIARAATDALAATLDGAKASPFLTSREAEEAQGPSVATSVLTATSTGGKEVELRIGGVCPGGDVGVVVRRVRPAPADACAPRNGLGSLTPAAFVTDDRLFTAHVDEVEELRLEGPSPGDVVELARKGNGFHLRLPTSEELDDERNDAALGLLASLVRSTGTLAAPTATVVRGRVVLRRAGGLGSETVELLEGGSTPFARRLADGRTLQIARDVAALLRPRIGALASRSLFPKGLRRLSVLRLDLQCGPVAQRAVREPEGYRLLEPRGFPIDAATLLDVTGAFLEARVEAWIEPSAVPAGAFAGAPCTVGFELGEDGGSFAFDLGLDAPGGIVARRRSDGAAFLAPFGLREKARRLLVDRHRFSVETSVLTKATLEHRGKRIVLRRVGDGLVRDEGPQTLSIPTLTNALETLRADDVAHLGPPREGEGFEAPQLRVTLERAGAPPLRFEVGAMGLAHEARVTYGRVAGIDAIYLIVRERIEPLLTSFEAP